MKRDVWLTHDWSHFCSQTQPQGCSSVLMSLVKALVEFLKWFFARARSHFQIFTSLLLKKKSYLCLKSQLVSQLKMLLNVYKCFRLQAAKVLFPYEINQEKRQVAGQARITEALLNTENKASSFSSGHEKRRTGGLKKMKDREDIVRWKNQEKRRGWKYCSRLKEMWRVVFVVVVFLCWPKNLALRRRKYDGIAVITIFNW